MCDSRPVDTQTEGQLASQAKLVDGIGLVLDCTHFKAPSPQRQSQHLADLEGAVELHILTCEHAYSYVKF